MLNNRYDFVILFDVENGNPNGDPDAGNSPRMDAETGYGFVTDVCIKRKIRNYVSLVKEGDAGYNILIKPDKSLNEKFTEAYEAEGLEKKQKGKKADDEKKQETICVGTILMYVSLARLCQRVKIPVALCVDLSKSILQRVYHQLIFKM